MYTIILDKYKKSFNSKLYHIDGKIITNKYCDKGREFRKKYKSKKSINLS